MLAKAAAVIEALEKSESTIAEIADTVGEPVSTLYRLVKSLVVIGWVEPSTRRGRYRLGLEFLRVGGLVEDSIDVREVAVPSLRRLAAETGSAVLLFIRRGLHAVCVERVEGRRVTSNAIQLGDSLSLYRGAGPLALLAFSPAGERDALLEQMAAAPDLEPQVPAQERLRRRIEQVRLDGYAISDESVLQGATAIAAPVFNHRGELEASISVTGIHDHLLASTSTIEAVVDEAASISRDLGLVSR